MTEISGELLYKESILNEREKTHGDYENTAFIAQQLKTIISQNLPFERHSKPVIAESLDMICTKLARILSGNPYEKDHWDDIAGYAKLVSERL